MLYLVASLLLSSYSNFAHAKFCDLREIPNTKIVSEEHFQTKETYIGWFRAGEYGNEEQVMDTLDQLAKVLVGGDLIATCEEDRYASAVFDDGRTRKTSRCSMGSVRYVQTVRVTPAQASAFAVCDVSVQHLASLTPAESKAVQCGYVRNRCIPTNTRQTKKVTAILGALGCQY